MNGDYGDNLNNANYGSGEGCCGFFNLPNTWLIISKLTLSQVYRILLTLMMCRLKMMMVYNLLTLLSLMGAL